MSSHPLWREQLFPLTMLVAALDQVEKDIDATDPEPTLTPYLGDIPVHVRDDGIIGYLKNEDGIGWAFHSGGAA